MALSIREAQKYTVPQQANYHLRFSASALILTGNVCIGNQIASLLHNVAWQTQVIHKELHVYDLLYRNTVDAFVVDIDTPDLNGLSCLFWCKHQYPSITTYAICSGGNSKAMQAARALGCVGFYYLRQGKILVDTRCGMAKDITSSQYAM